MRFAREEAQLSTATVLRPLLFSAGLLLFLLSSPLPATTIDFEGFPDSTILTNQYPGLSFNNAIILTAGISLNEFEFPPHSGVNVASDNNGPMTIDFSSPVSSVGGYFTYAEPLTLVAYNSSDQEVGSTASAFSSNMALSGDPGSSPNEFLSITEPGIASLVITGDPNGGSFALDDLTYTSSVPEPDTIALVFGGISLLVALIRGRSL